MSTPTIDTNELAALCKSPSTRKGLHIVDVSSKERFAKEHIAYAFNVPLEALEKKRESGLPRDRTVITYGESAEDAQKGAALYRALGFQVKAYLDGVHAWKEAELPVVG